MLKESEINLHWVLLNFFKQHVMQRTSSDAQTESAIWLAAHLGKERRLPPKSKIQDHPGKTYPELLREWSEKLFSDWQDEYRKRPSSGHKDITHVHFQTRLLDLGTHAMIWASVSLPSEMAERLKQGELTRDQTVQILLSTARLFPSMNQHWTPKMIEKLTEYELKRNSIHSTHVAT
ncbi:uncharacterized protein MELLADRAFT_73119 [Melampsora larici-populina 98AG31]|uniref:Uncharacterized protein n=1 Tax=Melampsora larici-populina (strain 98AG31 / pathotype 3-4-7) TaxID=747676 RepID=F4S3E4_MELLP|nr:uncharacterized protein MELLADRAFT_73119 [Melampsora larici-populina 98AG31]EGG00798.1 hypothetical protein MELLADRAFT_73119 [Melampsora larici-populina 98AG31]